MTNNCHYALKTKKISVYLITTFEPYPTIQLYDVSKKTVLSFTAYTLHISSPNADQFS